MLMASLQNEWSNVLEYEQFLIFGLKRGSGCLLLEEKGIRYGEFSWLKLIRRIWPWIASYESYPWWFTAMRISCLNKVCQLC